MEISIKSCGIIQLLQLQPLFFISEERKTMLTITETQWEAILTKHQERVDEVSALKKTLVEQQHAMNTVLETLQRTKCELSLCKYLQKATAVPAHELGILT